MFVDVSLNQFVNGGRVPCTRSDIHRVFAAINVTFEALGHGDIVLVYPKTEAFSQALPVFEFPKSNGLRLWVLPFCLNDRVLILPPSGACGTLDTLFAEFA
jgi:hypothetical protein